MSHSFAATTQMHHREFDKNTQVPDTSHRDHQDEAFSLSSMACNKSRRDQIV